ncbi:histidinol-phosphate transaminase [Rhizobacter sp. Root404]|uniref:histidinol-phosphate transaminase n=1 Tax=Rhizobacter sp. Root404 TaxID=1736528 RepID=UPI0006F52A74|nr:histidinol-phosphate transaminase [Rhizobacter sp. Root404]KQW38572.1 histidinol-phosphate aminotransferase [Rhizobacter sp. Root404]
MSSLQHRIDRVIRRDIQSMHAYAIQDSTGLVKLDAMENPFRLPEPLQRQLGERLGRVAINRYPVGCVADVIAALTAYVKLPAGCKLMLGNGSDELISLLAMACDLPGAKILAPLPGFVMYGMSAKLQGLGFIGVPTTASFELDEAAMLAAIETHRPAITYLAYPNNPTANLFDTGAVERIVAAVGRQDGLVVMDEAYQPFSSRTWMDKVAQHEHVLVMRTLSKFGLAGVRLGYMVGAAALIDEIDKVRPPYNISALNAEATLFALEHAAEFAAQAEVLRTERAELLRVLAELPGAQPFPSEANMILVRVPDSKRAFEGMKARGVLVKNIEGLHPLLKNCLRLTVGTPEENILMIDALKASL